MKSHWGTAFTPFACALKSPSLSLMVSPRHSARDLPFPMDQEDVHTQSCCSLGAHVCPSELSLQILEFPAQMAPSPYPGQAHSFLGCSLPRMGSTANVRTPKSRWLSTEFHHMCKASQGAGRAKGGKRRRRAAGLTARDGGKPSSRPAL